MIDWFRWRVIASVVCLGCGEGREERDVDWQILKAEVILSTDQALFK